MRSRIVQQFNYNFNVLLTRTSTTDELSDLLTEEILSGRLAPGAWLREEGFANQFDVSRNTLREAFHRLARDGLLVHRPHRGWMVASPSAEDIREIFRVRTGLEKSAVEMCDADDASELAQIAVAMTDAATAADWTAVVDLDLQFHARLVASLHSPRLVRFYEGLLRELRLSFVVVDRVAGEAAPPSHVPDHALIADAIRRGRIGDARQRLVAHLAAAEALVLDHLAGQGGE